MFINSSLTQLRNSGLCCKVYRTPSTPVGYADDLATGCINSLRLEQVRNIARSTGVLGFMSSMPEKVVYGKERAEHKRNVYH